MSEALVPAMFETRTNVSISRTVLVVSCQTEPLVPLDEAGPIGASLFSLGWCLQPELKVYILVTVGDTNLD
jgi:hypothetical protein